MAFDTEILRDRSEAQTASVGDVYKGRGVWVPHGQKASWIMEGAWALEREFDIAPYISRLMASAVIAAIMSVETVEDAADIREAQ